MKKKDNWEDGRIGRSKINEERADIKMDKLNKRGRRDERKRKEW